MTTTCGGKKIVGGYDKASIVGNDRNKKVYYSKDIALPKHTRVTVSLTAYAIDSWDNEMFIVKADGKEVKR